MRTGKTSLRCACSVIFCPVPVDLTRKLASHAHDGRCYRQALEAMQQPWNKQNSIRKVYESSSACSNRRLTNHEKQQQRAKRRDDDHCRQHGRERPSRERAPDTSSPFNVQVVESPLEDGSVCSESASSLQLKMRIFFHSYPNATFADWQRFEAGTGVGRSAPSAPPSSAWARSEASFEQLRPNNCIQGGAPQPPTAIAADVAQWPFLVRFVIEVQIIEGKLTWAALVSLFAKNTTAKNCLRRCDLLPLERLQKERWSWLPPQPDKHHFVFSCRVSLSGSYEQQTLQWQLNWPSLVSRRDQTGLDASKWTKRLFERYGRDQLLFVELPEGKEGGEIATKLYACRPQGTHTLRLLGRRWCLLLCRPETGDRKVHSQMVPSSLHNNYPDQNSWIDW
jgi:hypothetical protein